MSSSSPNDYLSRLEKNKTSNVKIFSVCITSNSFIDIHVVTAVMLLNGVFGAALSLVVCAAELLDLTYPMDNTSIFWPNGQSSFQLDILAKGLTPRGFWYQGEDVSAGTHLGTHMDAPNHFFQGAWSAGDIPPDRLVAPGVIVDIRKKAGNDPDSNLTLADLQAWETDYGPIPELALVLMCSGWSDRYPNRTLVFGNGQDNTSDFHFPGFDVEAVRWLIQERRIVGIGVDTPSMDFGSSTTFPVHVLTGKNNVYGLENVYQVCEVPPSGATIYSLPAKYQGSSGAPTRILAVWDNKPTSSSTTVCTTSLVPWASILYTILLWCSS